MTMLELEALRFTPEITDLEKRLVVAKGQGLGRELEQELGSADVSFYAQNR